MRSTVESSVSYRLSVIIGVLSHALDLTEGQPVGHSQRSCMISMEIADRLDLPSSIRQDLFSEDAAAAVRALDEHWDGSGYHRGVGAEHLSAEARILALADVFDALSADRPYRSPLDPEACFEILWKDAGAAFDPLYISALLSLNPSQIVGAGDPPDGAHVTIFRVVYSPPSTRN